MHGMPHSQVDKFDIYDCTAIIQAYWEQWRIVLYPVRADGRFIDRKACEGICSDKCRQARQWAITESLRWGEPTIDYCPNRRLIWAVPIMLNNELIGGLIAETTEDRVYPDEEGNPGLNFLKACTNLRESAEAGNLTNASLLELRRMQYQQEQMRAEAIHAYKKRGVYDLRDIYLREEPALLAAIRQGDAAEARRLMNRMLLAVRQQASGRMELIKSFFMELVITMCRTAVEAGGDPQSLLGTNYESIVELGGIEEPDLLQPWLLRMLEHVMDAFERHSRRSGHAQIVKALDYMRMHAAEELTREEVARVAAMSPAHFSRVFKKHLGRGFADILNQIRVDRTCEWLARTDKELALIALECGFKDQSYFTKVFHKYTGHTPKSYRLRHQWSDNKKKA